MPRPSTSTFSRPSASMIVLVPFDEGAVLHGGVADGHDLGQRPARQHEAADMLGEVAREAEQLLRQLEAAGEQRVGGVEPGLADIFLRQGGIAQAPDGGGERGDGVLVRGPAPCRPRARPSGRDRRSRWRRCRRGRGRSGHRYIGSPPRAAHARNRRRCRAAPSAPARRSARTGGRSRSGRHW